MTRGSLCRAALRAGPSAARTGSRWEGRSPPRSCLKRNRAVVVQADGQVGAKQLATESNVSSRDPFDHRANAQYTILTNPDPMELSHQGNKGQH